MTHRAHCVGGPLDGKVIDISAPMPRIIHSWYGEGEVGYDEEGPFRRYPCCTYTRVTRISDTAVDNRDWVYRVAE